MSAGSSRPFVTSCRTWSSGAAAESSSCPRGWATSPRRGPRPTVRARRPSRTWPPRWPPSWPARASRAFAISPGMVHTDMTQWPDALMGIARTSRRCPSRPSCPCLRSPLVAELASGRFDALSGGSSTSATIARRCSRRRSWGDPSGGPLAEAIGLDASTVSRHVRALLEDGLVVAERDPADGHARYPYMRILLPWPSPSPSPAPRDMPGVSCSASSPSTPSCPSARWRRATRPGGW